MSKKIVINTCYGGFSLSSEAEQLMLKKADVFLYYDIKESRVRNIARHHPLLVDVVEELGSKAWGDNAELKVVEIPEDVEWEIIEYDGIEHIAEQHRKWY